MRRKHDQILCAWIGSEIGARCPYCGAVSFVVESSGWMVLDENNTCRHANMAVDSGEPMPAIHFDQ